MASSIRTTTAAPERAAFAEGVAREPIASSEHIRFIDGLRAISILAVVGYHVGLPFLPGGFVGVDVFFVISGYLIIGQIVAGLGNGFSFPEFWGRRAVRILPPYLLVVLACIAIAPFILVLPEQHADFGRQVTYSAAMLVNHYFLAQEGYFDGAADTKPLLHLWSLAVEEQFYLVAPIILFALWSLTRRVAGRGARAALAVGVPVILAVASLSLCVLYTDADENRAFYVMPLRAWEFIAGGAIGFAVPHARRLPGWAHEGLSLVALLAFAYALSSLSSAIAFPSYWALIPAIGACAILLAGLSHPGATLVRALAAPPMVWIGQVSYAWYLWHWCLLSFRWIYQFQRKNLWLDAVAALVALALAILTHLWVERPLRSRRHALTKGKGWLPALIGIGACSGVASIGFAYVGHFAPNVTSTAVEKWAPVYDAIDRECRIDLAPSVDACLARMPGAPVGLLTGDSHSKAAFGTLYRAASSHGVLLTGIARGGCTPFFHAKLLSKSAKRIATCESGERSALANLGDPRLHLSFAVLTGLWKAYEKDLAYPSANDRAADQRGLFVEKLTETLDMLRKKGARRMIVIGQVPTFPNNPPECLARAIRSGVSRDAACSISRKKYVETRKVTHGWLKSTVTKQPDVRFIDPVDIFCDRKLCRPYDADAVLYINGHHLSNAGAQRIYAAFESDFDWAFGVQPAK